MGVVVVHPFVSAVAEQADSTLVGPNEWNANHSITLSGNLLALDGLATTGVLVATGSNAFTTRSLATGNGLSLSNASGTAGNPTISITLADSSLRLTAAGIAAAPDLAITTLYGGL